MKHRVGLGYDVHPFAAAGSPRPLVLGGVTIAGSVGLDGHSDADAVAHAVADSMLGIAGLPDLGELFPASDPEYAGADSMTLLREVAARVAATGWYIANVDVIIAAEQPKLAEHLAVMAANVVAALEPMANTLHDGVFVSVKAKRGEGVGFVGHAEGIAVWAVTLFVR